MPARAVFRLLAAAATLSLAAPVIAQDGAWDEGAPRGGGGYDVQVDGDTSPVTVETFQSGLAPYGEWVRSGDYGTVWRPRVAAGWRPYYYGRWEWTNEGWLWVSEEPFGWATYHYGRWAHDRGQGWLWVPGYQWAPAWVSWRFGGDAVGWAPLAPGLSLYVTSYAFVDFWWTFVPSVRFCGSPVWGIAYPRERAYRFYGITSPAPPRSRPPPVGWSARGGTSRPPPGGRATPAWGGPPPRYIEERTGRAVTSSRIVVEPRPGAGRGRAGEIGVYRPELAPARRPGAGGGGWQGSRGPGAPPAVRPPAGPGPQVTPRREVRPAPAARGLPPPRDGAAHRTESTHRGEGAPPSRAAPPRREGGGRDR